MERVDRAGWPSGPWDSEPDRVEWVTGGYYCLCNRARSDGHWNGYVGVPPGHPWHGLGYDAIHAACPDLEVHGGLTFASDDLYPDDLLCPAGAWVVGFDCAHYGDLSPRPFVALGDGKYRTLAYVQAECLRIVGFANGDAPVVGPILVRVVDGGRALVGGGEVTGDGAILVRDYVRGTGHIGVALDWLEDHAEAVAGLAAWDALELVGRLRRIYQ